MRGVGEFGRGIFGASKASRLEDIANGAPRVLIIDDDVSFTQIALTEWAKDTYGFRVQTARCEEWRDIYRRFEPQVLFLSSTLFESVDFQKQRELLETVREIRDGGTEVVVMYHDDNVLPRAVRSAFERGNLEIDQKNYRDPTDSRGIQDTVRKFGSFAKRLIKGIAERGDQQVLLWHNYKLHERQYERTKNLRHLERAKASLDTLYKRLERGSKSVMVAEYTDDSAVGMFSAIDPDLLPPHSPTDRLWAIRRRPILEAQQNYRDSLHAKKLKERAFNLAEASRPYEFPDNKYALTVSRLVNGPELDVIFTVLNPRIKGNGTVARDIKDALLRANIDDLVFWQANFGSAAIEPPQSSEQIISYYVENLVQGLIEAARFTYKGGKLTTKNGTDCPFIDEEIDLFRDAAFTVFGRYLTLDKRTMARMMDNSTQNSGLEIGLMREKPEILWQAMREVVAPRDKVDQVAVGSRYFHWDPAAGKFGHFLEDFFHVADSVSLDLSRIERDYRLSDFLRGKFGFEVPPEEFGMDIPLIGAYRSLRKRALIIGRYAARNEQRFNVGAKTADERDAKRKDYTAKAVHYVGRALDHLEQARAVLRSRANGSATDRDSVIEGIFSFQRHTPLTPEQIKTVRKLFEDANVATSSLAKLNYMQQFTARLGYYNQIHFNKL